MVLARVLVLSPGFPVAERPYHTPGIVETLAMIGRVHALTICALNAPPASGVHAYRGLKIVARSMARGIFGGLRFPFDVVWALWPNRTGVFALAARAPLVVSFLGAELSRDVALAYGASSLLRRRLVPAVVRRARALTAGSLVMQRRAQALFPDRTIAVAPMGVDASRFGAAPSRGVDALTAPRWSFGQPLRLIAVSDLSPVKRVFLIAAALDRLLAQGIDATLEVFGDLRRASPAPHPRAKYHGFVEPARVAAALREHHVLVHASAHESQGFALIEAALANLPIATARVGVAEELEALGAAIELVDHPAPEALAAAILRAAGHGDRSPAFEKVAARYDVTPCADRFSAILEEAAAR